MPRKKAKRFGAGVALSAIVMAVLMAIGGGMVEGVKDTAKSLVTQTVTWGQRWVEEIFPPAIPQADSNAALSILLAQLEGDHDGSQTTHVRVSVDRILDLSDKRSQIQLLRTDRILRRGPSSDVRDQRNFAESVGREWLKRSGAGLLIWGEVGGRDKVLRLNFLLGEGETKKRLRESFTLSQQLELSPDFSEDLALVIVARAVATLARFASNSEGLVPDVLEQVYPRLSAIGANPAVAQSQASCELRLTIAVVLMLLGDGKGDSDRLTEAIATSRRLIADDRCLADRSNVASANFVRAYSLYALDAHETGTANQDCLCDFWGMPGFRPSGSARLEEAITAFRETLKDLTRERNPLDWARTQRSLAEALNDLAWREGSGARLEEAVAAYQEALKEMTRERDPQGWALIQTGLGQALTNLGMREGSTARLQEAIPAFREALKERTQERAPVAWATSKKGLATALWELGLRESSTALFEEAIAITREVLNEQTRERDGQDWARTQTSLGSKLSHLARFAEAIAAYREALKELTRERAPLEWAQIQNSLGLTLTLFGQKEAVASPLDKGSVRRGWLGVQTRPITADIAETIGVREMKGALIANVTVNSPAASAGLKSGDLILAVNGNLIQDSRDFIHRIAALSPEQHAQMMLIRGGEKIVVTVTIGKPPGLAHFELAIVAYREALKERTRERVPRDWADTQFNLGIALSGLGVGESSDARFEEAVAAFREALKEQTREREQLVWARTQAALGNALVLLGQRLDSAARLEEGIAALREALKEQTSQHLLLEWAQSQGALGLALLFLGERTRDATRLEESVYALRAALQGAETAGAPRSYLDQLRSSLIKGETALAELRANKK